MRESNRDIGTETEKWKERDTHRLREPETDKGERNRNLAGSKDSS